MTPKMKDTIPEGWHTYTLGEIYTERKEAGDPELPILTVSIHIGVSDGALDEEEIGKTVKRIADKTQYKTARAGDLVFNMMRAWQGAIGVARSDGLVSPAYIVATPNEELVYPLFMDYYMKSPKMVGIINRQSYGVTDFRKRLYWDSFTPIKCTLPSLAEQKKIVEIICEQDKVIELQQKKIDEIIKLKKGYFLKLFPREGTIVPKLRFKGFNGDWEQRKLGDLCQTSRLSVNPQDEADSWFYEYSMPAFDRGNGPDYVLGESMNSARIVIKEPCVLYNKLNVRKRRVWYVDKICGKSVCSGEFVPILSHNVDLPLLAQILISDKVTEDMEAVSSGTSNSQKRVQPSVIMDYNIVIPRDIAEQKAISDFMFGLDNTVFLHQRKLEQEKQKKKALMQLLLTGIVRV